MNLFSTPESRAESVSRSAQSLSATRQIFFDTETTGLDPSAGDRIVEIACIEWIDRIPTGEKRHFYLNPERDVPAEAVAVHGLTAEFLADKSLFAEVAADLAQFLSQAELIAYNAPFDVGFLDAEFARLDLPPLAKLPGARITDALALARERYPGQSNSLNSLCRRLEVDISGRELHGALKDALLLAEVYVRMTRQQDALISEAMQMQFDADAFTLPPTDPSAFIVLEANAAEIAEHERILSTLRHPAMKS